VPGIYRSQASLAPGVKVRMGTKAAPHAGIGVKAYAWSTSPLRRYTDLVNQWQIIAAARHGRTAALAAPFKPKDAELFSIISGFDAAYSAYNGNQAGMERYWTLQIPAAATGMTELDGHGVQGRPGARRRRCRWCCRCWARRDLPRGAGAREAGRDRPDHAGRRRHRDRTPGCGTRRIARPASDEDDSEDRNRGRSDCDRGGCHGHFTGRRPLRRRWPAGIRIN
jgi:hypothetical protein